MKHLNLMKFLVNNNRQIIMMIKKIIFGLVLIIAITSCSTTKSIHSLVVPEGSVEVVKIPAKMGLMTEEEIRKWPHDDLLTDSIPGMSLEKAYQFVADKKGTTVIIGILDSGIDIEHEDLKDNVWTNTDEIAGNGIDDDKNGYTDDIHGWNFLGGLGDATPQTLEITRIYRKLNNKYGNKTEDEISAEDEEEYAYYQKAKKDFDKRVKKANEDYSYYQKLFKMLVDGDGTAQKKLNKKDYTISDLNTLPMEDQNAFLMRIVASGASVDHTKMQLESGMNHFMEQINLYDVSVESRITGDDGYDINDVPYGDNVVTGSVDDEIHGTHVSGITMATRDNGTGMNGVAKNVKLMAVRTLSNGDEYDKDVALAIRYAVDNGAKVVNMSFGKSYSPNPEWVYDAIKYAESKDVLLVHGSGNDHKNLDSSELEYPNDAKDKINEFVDNMINVGAITRYYNDELAASFSNYGKLNVDIFAPGTEIYSTFPKNEYESIQGTSMSAPEVAGVAALVRSYYPQLSASQVKHIIMNSGTKVDLEVKLPGGGGKKVPFSELSVSGRILNAYNALKMADAMVNGK